MRRSRGMCKRLSAYRLGDSGFAFAANWYFYGTVFWGLLSVLVVFGTWEVEGYGGLVWFLWVASGFLFT